MSESTSPPSPARKEFPASRNAKIIVWPNPTGYSVTVSHPRFKNQQGQWQDGSFFPNEVPMLIYALKQALDYCYTTPIPAPTPIPPVPSMDNDPLPI